ncbi:MAG TPA: phosphonate metabolism transcriptional regulator PhnF [Magnetospirillaceae bacterium]|jgi:GntR family phosphonate transport system transcriptional regulator
MTGAELDRGNGRTLWLQIAAQLEERILSGTWKPGERLPTELTLADNFAVNRHTARRALAALAEQGLVRVEQGRGTFVQESVVDYRLGKRTRFSENLSSQNHDPSGRLLRAEEMPAATAVAKALGLRKGSAVIMIERLGEADGRPINVSSHYFPKARFPTFIECYRNTGSITAALARCGVADYARKSTKITARAARASDARLLGQPSSRPILMTESINVDTEGQPIEYSVGRWASDRVQLVVEPGT